MAFWNLFNKHSGNSFKEQLRGILGYSPVNVSLYRNALTHRSVKEPSSENNERLEYLGDAILSALIADYLFMRANPKGRHREQWGHAYGCRRWFNVERDTVTYRITAVYKPGEDPPVSPSPGRGSS